MLPSRRLIVILTWQDVDWLQDYSKHTLSLQLFVSALSCNFLHWTLEVPLH